MYFENDEDLRFAIIKELLPVIGNVHGDLLPAAEDIRKWVKGEGEKPVQS